MQITLKNVVKKSADWILTDGVATDGTTFMGASMNRTNKDGTVVQWPQWETLADGVVIDGNLWTNPTNQKQAIYPPKPKAAGGFTPRGAGAITKAMETKAANIEVAQTRKNDAIALAGAMRDSTLITLAALKDQPFPTDEEFKAEWTKWVKWILNQHEQPFL